MLNILRSAGFRLAVGLSLSFSALFLIMFGFIYLKATQYQIHRTDAFLVAEDARLAALPEGLLIRSVGARMTEGIHRLTISALFLGNGTLIAGNLTHIPGHLRFNGKPYTKELVRSDTVVMRKEPMRVVAKTLPNGDVLIVGRSLDDIAELRRAVSSTLLLGLVPSVLLTLGLSAVVSWRTLRRVQAIDFAIERIISGELSERLPTRGTNDSLDRLVRSVNGILDKIGILLEELRDVGNNIAHDLRTPLARVRTRLERCLDCTDSADKVEETIEIALSELDQTATIIAALLRIGEIENHRRRSAFASITVALLAQELFEGYQPVAEIQNIELTAQVDPTMCIFGDWHLMTEALSNLIENALKFTPTGGSVRILGFEDAHEAIIRVADTGPGIPLADQKAVFSRFYRGETHRQVRGSGLGLSLVQAICRLHGFSIDVAGGPPGCVIDIRCGKVSRDLKGLSALTANEQVSETHYPDLL